MLKWVGNLKATGSRNSYSKTLFWVDESTLYLRGAVMEVIQLYVFIKAHGIQWKLMNFTKAKPWYLLPKSHLASFININRHDSQT